MYKFLLVLFLFISFSYVNAASADEPPFPPYYFSADLLKYPEIIDGETVKKYITFDYPSTNTKYINDEPYTKEHWENLVENMDVANVPNRVDALFAFVLKSVNMRMSPSDAVLHSGDPKFDMNQYTRLSASSPVAILHLSKDGKYYFVQAEFMRGWIPRESVEIYEKSKFDNILKMPFVRVMKEKIKIGGVVYSIGDRIPVKRKLGFGYALLLPNGKDRFNFVNNRIKLNNQRFTATRMRRLADRLVGDPYDWGGKEGYRDCSAFVRDLWLVFGLDLPRNTALQSAVGKEIMGKPSSKEEFYDTLSKALPFKTLIFFKGHVMLYGGMDDDDYIIYHAVNRLAKDSGETTTISSVVKQKLFKDEYSDIWKRVIKVTGIGENL